MSSLYDRSLNKNRQTSKTKLTRPGVQGNTKRQSSVKSKKASQNPSSSISGSRSNNIKKADPSSTSYDDTHADNFVPSVKKNTHAENHLNKATNDGPTKPKISSFRQKRSNTSISTNPSTFSSQGANTNKSKSPSSPNSSPKTKMPRSNTAFSFKSSPNSSRTSQTNIIVNDRTKTTQSQNKSSPNASPRKSKDKKSTSSLSSSNKDSIQQKSTQPKNIKETETIDEGSSINEISLPEAKETDNQNQKEIEQLLANIEDGFTQISKIFQADLFKNLEIPENLRIVENNT